MSLGAGDEMGGSRRRWGAGDGGLKPSPTCCELSHLPRQAALLRPVGSGRRTPRVVGIEEAIASATSAGKVARNLPRSDLHVPRRGLSSSQPTGIVAGRSTE